MASSVKMLGAAGSDLVDAARKLGESAVAAGSVIGRRAAMGARALQDPASLDAAELNRMSTEKIAAFAASSSVLLGGVRTIQTEMAQYAAGQTTASFGAAIDIATAAHPLAALEIQQRWLAEAWRRANRHALKLAALSAGASNSALAPVHATVTGNARRLSKGR